MSLNVVSTLSSNTDNASKLFERSLNVVKVMFIRMEPSEITCFQSTRLISFVWGLLDTLRLDILNILMHTEEYCRKDSFVI